MKSQCERKTIWNPYNEKMISFSSHVLLCGVEYCMWYEDANTIKTTKWAHHFVAIKLDNFDRFNEKYIYHIHILLFHQMYHAYWWLSKHSDSLFIPWFHANIQTNFTAWNSRSTDEIFRPERFLSAFFSLIFLLLH